MVNGDDTVRRVIGTVIEQERLVDDRNRGAQVRQRPWKARVQLLVRYIVAAVLDSLPYTCGCEDGTVEADENQKYGKASNPGLFEEFQLGIGGVGEDRLGAEGQARFEEGPSQSLGLDEGPAVDVIGRGGRVGVAENAGNAVRVDVR